MLILLLLFFLLLAPLLRVLTLSLAPQRGCGGRGAGKAVPASAVLVWFAGCCTQVRRACSSCSYH